MSKKKVFLPTLGLRKPVGVIRVLLRNEDESKGSERKSFRLNHKKSFSVNNTPLGCTIVGNSEVVSVCDQWYKDLMFGQVNLKIGTW